MDILNRREFLKLTGLAFASSVMLPTHRVLEHRLANPQIRFDGNLLRGTSDGTILISNDNGKTWSKLVNFGDHQTVIQLLQKNGLIFVNLGLGSYDFWLKSADGQKWLTV